MNQPPHNPLETPEKPTMVIDMHDGSNEMVSIIVVHHNKPDFLNMCLQSIYAMSNTSNYEVIVVDNASTDEESHDFLNAIEQEGVRVIRNSENLYFSAAANKGAAVADKNSKYLFFLHADTIILLTGWIDTMINISEGRGSGLVGCQLQQYYIAKQKFDFVPEWCMMVTRDCWRDCGPFPEELPLIGNAFIVSLKAQMLGYKPTACTNGIAHHYRAYSYDPNEFEKLGEQAQVTIPKVMRQQQLAN